MQATARSDSSKLPPPPHHAKNALQNTINIDRLHHRLYCSKTFILLAVYMQHSLSFLHPYWGDAKGLLSTGGEGG